MSRRVEGDLTEVLYRSSTLATRRNYCVIGRELMTVQIQGTKQDKAARYDVIERTRQGIRSGRSRSHSSN